MKRSSVQGGAFSGLPGGGGPPSKIAKRTNEEEEEGGWVNWLCYDKVLQMRDYQASLWC